MAIGSCYCSSELDNARGSGAERSELLFPPPSGQRTPESCRCLRRQAFCSAGWLNFQLAAVVVGLSRDGFEFWGLTLAQPPQAVAQLVLGRGEASVFFDLFCLAQFFLSNLSSGRQSFFFFVCVFDDWSKPRATTITPKQSSRHPCLHAVSVSSNPEQGRGLQTTQANGTRILGRMRRQRLCLPAPR